MRRRQFRHLGHSLVILAVSLFPVSFGTDLRAARTIAPVTLLEPALGSLVYSVYPGYVWSGAGGGDSAAGIRYELQVSSDSDFSSPQVMANLKDTAQWQISSLQIGMRYFWKVIRRDSLGITEESAVGTFRIYLPGDLDESHNITAEDIILMVNFVFKSVALDVPQCAADVSGTAGVGSVDIVYLVAHVFRGGAAPEPRCAPDASLYWPLAEGNYWLYELCWGEPPCIDPARRMEVLHRGPDTAVVTGQPWSNDTISLRSLGTAIDRRWPDTAWTPFYRFEKGTWMRPPEGLLCNDTVFMAVPETDSIVTPAGTFYGCLRVQSAQRCFDAGIVAEWWAPGVGLVSWVQDNIAGYQYFYLSGYRAKPD